MTERVSWTLCLFLLLHGNPARAQNDLPNIEARTFKVTLEEKARSERVFLFKDPLGAGPKVGKVLLLKPSLESQPKLAVRILKIYPDRRQFIAKGVRLYSSTRDLPNVGESMIAIEKVADLTPFEASARTVQDRLDIEELEEFQARTLEQDALQPPAVVTPATKTTSPRKTLPPPAIAPAPVEPAPPATPPDSQALESFPEGYQPDPMEIDDQARMSELPSEPLPQPAPENFNENPPSTPQNPAPRAAPTPISTPTSTSAPAPIADPVIQSYDPELDAGITPASEGDDYLDTGDTQGIEARRIVPLITDKNELGMMGGFFRNLNSQGASVYYSGAGFNYARLFSHMGKFKEAGLQDGVFGEIAIGLYRVFSFASANDSASVLPIVLKGRYQLFFNESISAYGYGGIIKNFTVSSNNMSSSSTSRLSSFLPALGVGAEFKLGPRWHLKIDAGLDLTSLGLIVRF